MNSLYLRVHCRLLLHQAPGTSLSGALKIKSNPRPLNEGVIIEAPLLRMNSQTEPLLIPLRVAGAAVR